MSSSPTSPTAQVLAQWDDWSARCTDRLFDLDARVNAEGTDDDRLDIGAVFVARKAIVERIEAMRAIGPRDDGRAAALAATPLVDEQGGRVADDLPSAAKLVDAILGRIEGHLREREADDAAVAQARTSATSALDEAAPLADALGDHVAHVADLRGRLAAAGSNVAALTQLSAEAEHVLNELRLADGERRRVLDAIPGTAERVAALSAREAEVRALVEEVRQKVAPVPKLAVPSVAGIGEVPAYDGLPWPAARERLQAHLTKIDRVGAALDEVERRFRTALDRRNDLRGLLQSYRDKAGDHRLAEDPRLDPAYRAAHDVLWSAPCDLGAAESLVNTYTETVNAILAGRDEEG